MLFRCFVSLVIKPISDQHIAIVLFRTHLEADEKCRYIILQNGSKRVPREETQLLGAQLEGIDLLLGHDIGRAIATSIPRQEEVDGGMVLTTNCVTIQISRHPSVRAILYLTLEQEEGFQI
jgi:hypothetical protein